MNELSVCVSDETRTSVIMFVSGQISCEDVIDLFIDLKNLCMKIKPV